MRQKGFSLVELLIVVAIIAIIVAIAVPNLLTSRQAAQSAAAAGDLRTINSAMIAFASGAGNGQFAATFTALEGNNYLPANFSNAGTTYNRGGYTGTLSPGTGNATYNVVTNPIAGATNSVFSYYTDESGTIRYKNSNGAANTDKPMGT
jgi:prepilin-type N-terminal cleavage/methylation domain-containing protein